MVRKYFKNLEDPLLNQVQITKSNKLFKFDDRHQIISLSSVKIPAQIGQKNCFINTEIVDENIPLLICKTSLKGKLTKKLSFFLLNSIENIKKLSLNSFKIVQYEKKV